MLKITPSNIISAINGLPRNRSYDYPNSRTKTKIIIKSVSIPEGPVVISRYFPTKGQGPKDGKDQSISISMISRFANAISQGKPLNVDRALGASYNTRSALEAILAHTSEFYMCYPGRLELKGDREVVKKGHKHILWMPEEPHENGKIIIKDVDMVISERIVDDVVYDALSLPSNLIQNPLDIDIARRHAQIQIALVLIGEKLGYRTWVARNDKSIEYKNKKVAEFPSVIPDLRDQQVLTAYGEAIKSADLIDCIWFRNGKFMPAVLEVEHSTGVLSGLTRMKRFFDLGPNLKDIRWTIVAPDELRNKVIEAANRDQYRAMDVRYFSYSSVEELYALCFRRNIAEGVNDNFLDAFMERCVEAAT